MKIVMHSLFVFVLLIVAASPAYSAETANGKYKVIQVWTCQIEDGVTEADVDAMGQAKLAALRQMPGGESANLSVLWPVAVSNTGQVDVHVVVEWGSFVDFGKLWDAYTDSSALAKADDATEGKIVCPDSEIWEVHEVIVN